MQSKDILTLPFEERKTLANRLRKKYIGRVPVVVIGNKINIIKQKYLAPCDITLQQLQYSIRKHIEELKPHEAIFLFINNTLISGSTLMSTIDREHKKEDDFVYITVSRESVFGYDK